MSEQKRLTPEELASDLLYLYSEMPNTTDAIEGHIAALEAEKQSLLKLVVSSNPNATGERVLALEAELAALRTEHAQLQDAYTTQGEICQQEHLDEIKALREQVAAKDAEIAQLDPDPSRKLNIPKRVIGQAKIDWNMP